MFFQCRCHSKNQTDLGLTSVHIWWTVIYCIDNQAFMARDKYTARPFCEKWLGLCLQMSFTFGKRCTKDWFLALTRLFEHLLPSPLICLHIVSWINVVIATKSVWCRGSMWSLPQRLHHADRATGLNHSSLSVVGLRPLASFLSSYEETDKTEMMKKRPLFWCLCMLWWVTLAIIKGRIVPVGKR